MQIHQTVGAPNINQPDLCKQILKVNVISTRNTVNHNSRFICLNSLYENHNNNRLLGRLHIKFTLSFLKESLTHFTYVVGTKIFLYTLVFICILF